MKVYIAIVRTKHDEFALAATTVAGRTKKLADWCRQSPVDQWFAEGELTDEDIAAMDDETVVDTYFAINPSDGYTEDEEEVALDLAVVLEGGNVSSVISGDAGLEGELVKVIDYDTDGADPKDLSRIHQTGGGTAEAYAWETFVEHSDVRAFTEEEEAEYAAELAAEETAAAEESYANAVAAAGLEQG